MDADSRTVRPGKDKVLQGVLLHPYLDHPVGVVIGNLRDIPQKPEQQPAGLSGRNLLVGAGADSVGNTRYLYIGVVKAVRPGVDVIPAADQRADRVYVSYLRQYGINMHY